MCAKQNRHRYRIEREEVKKNIKKTTVQNLADYLDERIAKCSDKEPIEEAPKQGGRLPEGRQKCTRQVYTTTEVAQLSLERLKRLNIQGRIERCNFCGMLHIQELR